ncbi:MAG: hypothetical protein PF961_13665 [Planctomycetota bacterium]|jgi:hypothetical protein|nr:hypothetical protein [Planctomycetota bacterium]
MSNEVLTEKQRAMLLLLRELISDAKSGKGTGRPTEDDKLAVHALLEVMHHLPGLALNPEVGSEDRYWLDKKVAAFFRDLPMTEPQDQCFYAGLFKPVGDIIRAGPSGGGV